MEVEKTSVLEELVQHFNYILSDQFDSYDEMREDQRFYIDRIEQAEKISDLEKRRKSIQEAKKMLEWIEDKMKNWLEGVVSNFTSYMVLREKYQKGNFIFAYYKAEREFQVEEYKNIEKIEFQDKYSIAENPGTKFTKYLVDVKATQAFTKNKEKAEKIDKWFQAFEDILRRIFNDKNLQLKFDDETFQFSICETDRDPFDFNTMSSGYSAVFDSINDLIIRMEAKSGLRTEFDMEGVVLVDEIETHLHLELQTMSVFSENQIPENLTLQKLSA